jgi:hypothetical protein
VEFTKTLGKPKQTEAMKAGSARHAELEVEVSLLHARTSWSPSVLITHLFEETL